MEGREIIINPAVGCFLLSPWNNCDKGYCHGCFTAVVTVVSLLWNKCDNRLGTSVTTVLEQLCQMGIQFSIENCNQIMTVWGVLIYRKWSFLLDIKKVNALRIIDVLGFLKTSVSVPLF